MLVSLAYQLVETSFILLLGEQFEGWRPLASKFLLLLVMEHHQIETSSDSIIHLLTKKKTRYFTEHLILTVMINQDHYTLFQMYHIFRRQFEILGPTHTDIEGLETFGYI